MQETRSQLLGEAQSHLPKEEMQTLSEAFHLAQNMYGKYQCLGGELCIEHVEKVARLLLPFHPDVHTLMATLLQYARTKENLEVIEKKFGKKVRNMISSLSILEGAGTLAMHSPSQIKRIALALSTDVHVLLIFLHNRWHILENSINLPEKEQVLLARETLTVLAPICARLGMYSLKYTLETLAFHILYPEEATDVWEKLSAIRNQQGSFMGESQKVLERLLKKEKIRAHIYTREKHPYSIFRKLQKKNLHSVTDIYDLFGMRILVENVEDCYRVLGIIHRTYRPLTHRMKDYIAMPKPNGYRSLHTTALGLSVRDSSFPVEIQIRTYEMDEEAEYGIAAHWNYKERSSNEMVVQTAWKERMNALQQLSQETEDREDGDDLHEEVADRIYVLTPKGDPLELPKGATPLDFAFRIHTDIGLCFRSAKINGKIASLDQELENGDLIEIQTWNEPRPSPEWIHQVHTKDARAKVRSYFSTTVDTQHKEDRIAQQHIVQKAQKPTHVTPVTYVAQLDTETALPLRYARCCSPQKHTMQRPPIVGVVGRKGIVTVHWSGCEMLKNANPERFVRAQWKVKDVDNIPTKKSLFKRMHKGVFARAK